MSAAGKPGERGMALLTVLLLVAVMGALTAATLETINRSVRLAGNSRGSMQARYHALAAEALALQRIEEVVAATGDRLTLAGGWNGRTFRFPADDGSSIAARVSDGGNCFNLNSVVDGGGVRALKMRPRGVLQFTALMVSLGIADQNARRVAFSLADWIDSDSMPLPLGGEDEAYRRAAVPYRTSNTLLAETSELRAVAGTTPEIYDVIRPWVCTLPTTDLSPINLNTLEPQQAPLLAMIMPGALSVDTVRQVLAGRPATGWESLLDFWRNPALAALAPTTGQLEQPKLTTRYFNVEIDVDAGGNTVMETALLDVAGGRATTLQRRWTVDE